MRKERRDLGRRKAKDDRGSGGMKKYSSSSPLLNKCLVHRNSAVD